ncbi:MAG: ATP-binding cassette domain-containing protein [Deltaproteobacteria bacterium]|nr:ATP-binding cassette domain-containing protein [Deltaproteobacteria bacterium]
MIAIDELHKHYGETHALRGVSFEVPKGQVVGFLGPNGAGKSTTMKILTGYVDRSQGSVRVGGVDIEEAPIEARRKIGYLPESNPLYDDMMVADALDFVAQMREVPNNVRQSRIQNAVERCGLGPVFGKNIHALSKGFRQRVGLAQAILHEPDLLILDEPTTGLDPNQIVEIRELIKELGEEKTVLMSSHVLSEVQATSSRVIIISDGQLVADDTPEALTAQSNIIDVVVAPKEGGSMSRKELFSILAQVPGVLDVESIEDVEQDCLGFRLKASEADPRRELFDAMVDANQYILQLHQQQQSLEDIFRKLTSDQ